MRIPEANLRDIQVCEPDKNLGGGYHVVVGRPGYTTYRRLFHTTGDLRPDDIEFNPCSYYALVDDARFPNDCGRDIPAADIQRLNPVHLWKPHKTIYEFYLW